MSTGDIISQKAPGKISLNEFLIIVMFVLNSYEKRISIIFIISKKYGRRDKLKYRNPWCRKIQIGKWTKGARQFFDTFWYIFNVFKDFLFAVFLIIFLYNNIISLGIIRGFKYFVHCNCFLVVYLVCKRIHFQQILINARRWIFI